MHVVLDTRAALIERIPDLGLAFSRKHGEERQRFLIDLLTTSYERRRPHAKESAADSFDRSFLVSGLRCSPRNYKRILSRFYTFSEENRGYDRDRHLTKAYRLRPDVLAGLSRVYEGDEPLPVLWCGDDGEPLPEGTGPPANGLPPTLSHRLAVPSVLSISKEQIDSAISRIQRWIAVRGSRAPLDPEKRDGATLEEALRLLYVSRKWVVSLGGLPNLYTLHSTGRAGPSGFHVIQMPSALRRVLFEGRTLVDYDIASCFPSIFISLGKAAGFPTIQVEQYVNAKHDYHARWVWMSQKRSKPDDFKSVTSSWFTGGNLSSCQRTHGAQLVGSETMQRLVADRFTVALYREVREGMKRVVRDIGSWQTDGAKKVLVNAVGATYPPEGAKVTFGGQCCHILTGYEQYAIRSMCHKATGLQAIIYDGYVASPQDTRALEEELRQDASRELGVDLQLHLKRTSWSEPIPEMEADSKDF